MGIFKKDEKVKTAKKAPKKEVVVAEEKKPAATKVTPGSIALKVVVRPLVTEKAAVMQSNRTYSFIVKNDANKPEVAKAIKELYGVIPARVRIINVQGHRVRFGKYAGKRSDYKKAMVTLKPGDSITIHEGV